MVQKTLTLLTFGNALIKIGRPIPKPVYDVHNPVGLTLLTRLRLGLIHLNQHKFNHNFQYCLNPLCSCSLEVESVSNFFLHCHCYSNIRSTLLNQLQSIDINLLNQEDNIVVEVLLYGSTKFTNNQNFRLLSSSIDYILKSERFSGLLLQHGESIFKCALSYFYLKGQSRDLVMWGHSTLFSSSIVNGSLNLLTKFHYFISIHHHFHSKEIGYCTILHYI